LMRGRRRHAWRAICQDAIAFVLMRWILAGSIGALAVGCCRPQRHAR